MKKEGKRTGLSIMAPIFMHKRHKERQYKENRPLTDYERWLLDNDEEYTLTDGPIYDSEGDSTAIQEPGDFDPLNQLESLREQLHQASTFEDDETKHSSENYEAHFENTATCSIQCQVDKIGDYVSYTGIRPLLVILVVLVVIGTRARTSTQKLARRQHGLDRGNRRVNFESKKKRDTSS
ncbi:hypothetical protein BGW36DRAFT_435287 [Talaromyces proteolyticus]|uniref:Uncharacterized protein n=1 Tax=Talaromyces proteolyticus TaxID=1131652 RepID=A0AAD4L2I1_9EURO|nr:uncharacterized protein BGW36DRAFT_435287 [Talaromyces proteolyticus]KAH8705426.1 hypothetical protein BGW36DRAFT_435287 [Talaromyces proteolyticus]